MRFWFLLITCLLTFSTSKTFAQQTGHFETDFNKAIVALSNNKVEDAEYLFMYHYKKDSSNMNLAYLLGRCYAEMGKKLPYSIYLLNKAKSQFSPRYNKRNFNERNVSEYVFYYLLMAYSKYGECDKTLETLHQFYKIYSYENEWYLVKGQELHHSCEQREIEEPLVVVELTEEPEEKKEEPKKEYVPTKPEEPEEVVIETKKLRFSTRAPAYGVQVGASLEPKFTYEFPDLKNIQVYIDENGVFRYIIGRFIYEKQAEKLLKQVIEKGYSEAFIVNVRDKKKFSEQVISLNFESISKQIVGEVDFKVQVGAFRGDTIPEELVDLYLELDSISEIRYKGLTIMTVGSFKTKLEAEFLCELVRDIGIKDAFVTAFNYNRKIDMKQALLYLERQEALKEEKKKKRKNKKK